MTHIWSLEPVIDRQRLPAMKFLHRAEDGLLVLVLGAMIFLALLQILLRNLFDFGLLWIEPLLRILVLWVAMLGAMVATREQNHISIDVVSRYLPSNWARVISALTCLVSGVLCLGIAWTAIEFIRYEYEDGTLAFWRVPAWICQSILPVGFTVMGLRFLWSALGRASGSRSS